MHVGQSAFDAVVIKAQAFVVQPQQMEDSGVQIIDGSDMLLCPVAEVVGGTVGEAAFEAGTGKPNSEAVRIVIAAGSSSLKRRHATKFGDPDDERVLEHAALFQITNEPRARLIEDWTVDLVLRLQGSMPVPVADTFTHGVCPVEELHEAHAALQEAAGKYAIASEAGLDAIGVVDTVTRE